MKKRWLAALGLITVLLIVLFLLSSTDWFIKEKQDKVYKIAVLVDAADDAGWENFRMGMDRAALEFEADISFVTLYDEGELGQQTALLARELEGGTQGVILKAENLAYQAKMLESVPKTVPVLVLGSAVESPRVRDVLAPDAEVLGQGLAYEMLTQDAGDQVLLVTQPGERADIENILEILTPLLEAGGKTVRRLTLTDPGSAKALVDGLMARGDTMVCAPELRTALLLADAVHGRGDRLPLYGGGWSGDVRRALEQDSMRGSAVYDAYHAGYLAVKQMVARLSGKHPEPLGALRCGIATRDTMYSPRYETMLFPIS